MKRNDTTIVPCLTILPAIAALVFLTGCGGGGPDLYNLSGNVTFQGKPVPKGEIQFIPIKGNEGPAGRAEITDGKYDTATKGKGTVGGPHRVVITGFDGVAAEELPMGKPIFQEYTVEFEIPKEEGATKDFQATIQKKPGPKGDPLRSDL